MVRLGFLLCKKKRQDITLPFLIVLIRINSRLKIFPLVRSGSLGFGDGSAAVLQLVGLS